MTSIAKANAVLLSQMKLAAAGRRLSGARTCTLMLELNRNLLSIASVLDQDYLFMSLTSREVVSIGRRTSTHDRIAG
jgi:hypothetical protein